MDKTILSSKTFQKGVRIMAIITIAILTLTTSMKIVGLVQNDFYRTEPANLLASFYFGLCLNLLVILFAVIMAIKPSTWYLIGVASLLYSVTLAAEAPLYMMNIPMLFITIGTLLCSKLYQKRKTLVLGIIAAISLYEILIPLYQGVDVFFDSLIQKIGFAFATAVAIFFFVVFKKDSKDQPLLQANRSC